MNQTVTALLALAAVAVAGVFAYKAVQASASDRLLLQAQARSTGERVGGALETLIDAGRGLFGE